MAEVIEFKKSGGCDWEDHFYPLNQKLNVNYAGRYVRESEYLRVVSELNKWTMKHDDEDLEFMRQQAKDEKKPRS